MGVIASKLMPRAQKLGRGCTLDLRPLDSHPDAPIPLRSRWRPPRAAVRIRSAAGSHLATDRTSLCRARTHRNAARPRRGVVRSVARGIWIITASVVVVVRPGSGSADGRAGSGSAHWIAVATTIHGPTAIYGAAANSGCSIRAAAHSSTTIATATNSCAAISTSACSAHVRAARTCTAAARSARVSFCCKESYANEGGSYKGSDGFKGHRVSFREWPLSTPRSGFCAQSVSLLAIARMDRTRYFMTCLRVNAMLTASYVRNDDQDCVDAAGLASVRVQ